MPAASIAHSADIFTVGLTKLVVPIKIPDRDRREKADKDVGTKQVQCLFPNFWGIQPGFFLFNVDDLGGGPT